MKKFTFPFLFAAAAMLASFTFKAPVQPVNTSAQTPALTWYDFESGYEKAAKEGKILLVDAYTDWCGWCKVMDRNTYTNAQIIETLNNDFVAVKFNPEKAKTFKFGGRTMNNDELLLWLGRGKSYGYPTSYFWTNPGKGESLLVSVGYEEPGKFAETLQTVLKRKGQ
jgi:thiol:disulfide interchange protein